MAEENCGCAVNLTVSVTGAKDGYGITGQPTSKALIAYCPKHAAVDDLIAALERCRKLLSLVAADIAPEYRGKYNAYDEAIKAAQDAIRKAQG